MSFYLSSPKIGDLSSSIGSRRLTDWGLAPAKLGNIIPRSTSFAIGRLHRSPEDGAALESE
jgi:hypothetical protein